MLTLTVPSYALPLPLPLQDVRLDACVAFEFNIDRTIERGGRTGARVLLSYSAGDDTDILSRLSYGDCLFDRLGLSADERLSLALRAQASDGYIICKTKYGTALLVTRLIATHGIALLLIPVETVSSLLGRIPYDGGSISYSKFAKLSTIYGNTELLGFSVPDKLEAFDSTAFKMTAHLLLLTERSLICSRSADETECLRFEAVGALRSTALLFGIHPHAWVSLESPVKTSLSELVCFTYLFSMITARLGSDASLGIKVTGRGGQSSARFTVFFKAFKAEDATAALAEHPEFNMPIELMKALGILDGYSVTIDADSCNAMLEVSALLCRDDPSLIGLKHPRRELRRGLSSESLRFFLSGTHFAGPSKS